MRRRTFLSAAGLGAVGLSAAACGGGGSTSGGGGAGGGSTAAATTAPELTGTGAFTYVQGKDNSGLIPTLVKRFNAMPENSGGQCTLIELSPAADQQRQSMVQNALAKSNTYGVLSTDVVWTSEFAANQWITQLDASKFPLDQYLPATATTGSYFGRLYAAPTTSDGGMLYYRTDLLKAAGYTDPPKTWDEMIAMIKKIKASNPSIGGYVGQFQKYEGLTVNFSEAVDSAGGTILGEDGKPDVKTSDAADGLNFLVNGFKQGYIPAAAITYMETESLQAFQTGQAIFMRQWPYAYALLAASDGSSKVNGKFAVAPLPGKTGPGVSSLGGHNLAISAYAQNKASCLKFIQFLSSHDIQKEVLVKTSGAPVFADLYDDATLAKQYPYLPVLKSSITNAKRRPAAVKYNDVTTAIQTAGYSALQGQQSTTDALSSLQSKLEGLITTS